MRWSCMWLELEYLFDSGLHIVELYFYTMHVVFPILLALIWEVQISASQGVQNVTVSVGDDAQLPCYQSTPLTWYLGQSPSDNKTIAGIATTNGDVYYNPPLTEDNAFLNNSTGSLTIRKVNFTNMSWYTCKSNISIDLYQSYLMIKVPPSEPRLLTPEFLPVDTTESIQCVVDRVYPYIDDMEWFLDGELLVPTSDWETTTNEDGTVEQTGTLALYVQRDYHNKTLECRVSASGAIQTGEVLMNVGYGASGAPIAIPSHQTLALNEPFTLSCDTEGLSPGNPTIYRYRWEMPQGDIFISSDPLLELAAYNWEQAGNYTCIVDNTFGESNSSTLAIVDLKPASSQLMPMAVAFIGVVVGATVVILVISMVLFIRRHRKSPKQEDEVLPPPRPSRKIPEVPEFEFTEMDQEVCMDQTTSPNDTQAYEQLSRDSMSPANCNKVEDDMVYMNTECARDNDYDDYRDDGNMYTNTEDSKQTDPVYANLGR